MNRLILAGLASLALAAGVVASPPIVPPTTRPRMPSPPIRPVYPIRPVIGVVVVPTTPGPRSYIMPAPVLPVQTPYTLYFRSGPLMPWSYYGSYRSLWMAEEIGLELEYYLGMQTWVR